MKVLMSIAAVLAVAVGFSLASAGDADAWCGVGFRCNAAVLVPTPHPIPLRRARRAVVAPAPCARPCGRVAVAPSPCGAPCPTSYYYMPPAYYADYSQPAYAGSCNAGPGNCYWRRNCWYDSFGRRFCN
jgi:hypothetical protein